MEPRRILYFFARLTCIFVIYHLSICSGLHRPKLGLKSAVFVALKGERLIIEADLQLPVNQSQDILTCVDSSDQLIYSCDVSATANQQTDLKLRLQVTNLTTSGVYSCQYKTVRVFWFLRLRDQGYREPITLNHTELILVIFTAVLLIFSVVGSVYVFRGNWRGHVANIGEQSKKNKSLEEQTMKEEPEDSMDVVTDPSSSFYASLEHRPRSIYDVLDHAAAKGESEKSKAKAKKKDSQQSMSHTPQNQHEGVFESVYENF